jgi:hypothetical protein
MELSLELLKRCAIQLRDPASLSVIFDYNYVDLMEAKVSSVSISIAVLVILNRHTLAAPSVAQSLKFRNIRSQISFRTLSQRFHWETRFKLQTVSCLHFLYIS